MQSKIKVQILQILKYDVKESILGAKNEALWDYQNFVNKNQKFSKMWNPVSHHEKVHLIPLLLNQ